MPNYRYEASHNDPAYYGQTSPVQLDGLDCTFELRYTESKYRLVCETGATRIAILKGSRAEFSGPDGVRHDFDVEEVGLASGRTIAFYSTTSGQVGGARGTLLLQLEVEVDGHFASEKVSKEREDVVARAWVSERAIRAAQAYPLLLAQAVHNVCIDFVRVGAQLWANDASLCAASAYFDSILSSEFAEAEIGMHAISSEPADDLAALDFEDSDDEADTRESNARLTKAKTAPVAPFRRIEVSQTSHATYLAVLVWLETRFIDFAPLLSEIRQGAISPTSRRIDRSRAIDALVEKRNSPTLPRPGVTKERLTPACAPYELYSDVATCYPAVRDAVLAFVVDRWDEVKDTPALEEVERRAAEGEGLPIGSAQTAMLLARRLAER
ncbi:uncharacterized protein JCM10292_006087 [Rhodotorula paludigena]|uniref:uncharacterized protein n=1 Tax=Rhodotorula paludigena TaxID=86838 RepID=UPI003171919D